MLLLFQLSFLEGPPTKQSQVEDFGVLLPQVAAFPIRALLKFQVQFQQMSRMQVNLENYFNLQQETWHLFILV